MLSHMSCWSVVMFSQMFDFFLLMHLFFIFFILTDLLLCWCVCKVGLLSCLVNCQMLFCELLYWFFVLLCKCLNLFCRLLCMSCWSFVMFCQMFDFALWAVAFVCCHSECLIYFWCCRYEGPFSFSFACVSFVFFMCVMFNFITICQIYIFVQ